MSYGMNPTAAETVRRGMLVELNAKGRVVPHSVPGGKHDAAFAAVYGPEQYEEYQSVYINQYTQRLYAGQPETRRDTLVLVRGGELIEAGMYLVSAGDGTLVSEYSMPRVMAMVARALESVDLRGEDDRLIRARAEMKR